MQEDFNGYTINAKTKDTSSFIFLHDALGCADTWKGFPRLIYNELGVDIWVYDRKGHGKSTKQKPVSTYYYMHEEAEDLHRFINQHQIKNPVLIGSSDGGTIAMLYASQYPTTAIVALGGHYKVDVETYNGVLDTIPKTKRLVEALTKYHGEKAVHLVKNWQNTWMSSFFRKWNIIDEIKKITCPSLLIQGDKDQYASLTHHTEISEFIGTSAKAITLKEVGHFPHLEAGDKTKKHIVEFLKPLLL